MCVLPAQRIPATEGPALLSSVRQIAPGIALAPGIGDGLDWTRGDAVLLTQQFAVLGQRSTWPGIM